MSEVLKSKYCACWVVTGCRCHLGTFILIATAFATLIYNMPDLEITQQNVQQFHFVGNQPSIYIGCCLFCFSPQDCSCNSADIFWAHRLCLMDICFLFSPFCSVFNLLFPDYLDCCTDKYFCSLLVRCDRNFFQREGSRWLASWKDFLHKSLTKNSWDNLLRSDVFRFGSVSWTRRWTLCCQIWSCVSLPTGEHSQLYL